MTCIAGIASAGKVWIGGDSAGVAGFDLVVRADEKVFSNGEFLFGFTSSFRMGQLLRYSFGPPALKEGQDVRQFMVTDFINGIRQCLKDGGYATKTNEQEAGGTFLVGFRGQLFEINSDYQVGSPVSNYAAVGAGDQIASGSLYSSKGQPPEKRVRLALEAAQAHSAAVRGPFVVLTIK